MRWRPIEPVAIYLAGGIPKSGVPETASQIIGVIPDLSATARTAPVPETFWVNAVGYDRVYVKLRGDQVQETLAAIDQLWKRLGAPRPIVRTFLDQQIEALYRDVTLLSRAMAAFAAVAVFVAALGLFGLATFAAESRTKEIGVRKALGASRADILRLVLWEFSRPVLGGSLVAWPVAYLIMRRWLEGFAERVDMGFWIFPAISALALAIAAVTVSAHALNVARTRPASALRYE